MSAMRASRGRGPRLRRDRRGVAALETAAVAPFLLLIVVACVDFGRWWSQRIELTNAVRAGAQYAVTAPNAEARIRQAVRDALPAGLQSAEVTSACYCGPLPAGTGMPPVAACDSACPAGSARMMTLEAGLPFTPVNFAVTPAVATAFRIDRVTGNVTIRHQ